MIVVVSWVLQVTMGMSCPLLMTCCLRWHWERFISSSSLHMSRQHIMLIWITMLVSVCFPFMYVRQVSSVLYGRQVNFLLKKGWIKGNKGTYIQLDLLYQVFTRTSLSEKADKCKGIDMCDPNYRNSEIDIWVGKVMFGIMIVWNYILWNSLTSIVIQMQFQLVDFYC